MITVFEPSDRGLRTAIRDAAPLLMSVGLLMAGNGLTSTLLGIRAGLEGFRPSVVGLVLAGYYAGYVVGSLMAPSTIARVGHIRVFSGLASLASAAVLVHAVRPEPATWFMLRVISGTCIAALYVVCETWLNGASTNRSRGGLLATYMIVVSGSLLAGQLLFSLSDPGGFVPFVVASLLVSLAVVPVSLVSFPAPSIPDPTPISVRRLIAVAPLGAVGAALSGFISAAMLGAGVVYAAEAGFNKLATGAFVGAALAGGVALQLPLGNWSDRVDRRIVIAAAAVFAAGVAVVASQVSTDRRIVLIILTTVAGGSAFPLYSLSVAHLNDYLDSEFAVAGGARMVLINGVGSIGGPIIGSAAIGMFGPESLFGVLACGYLIIAAYALFRMGRRSAVDETDRSSFSPLTVGFGATTAGQENEVDYVYALEDGLAEFGQMTVKYRSQGEGSSVVLIGDVARGRLDGWEEMLSPLAANGLRAITPWLGAGHGPEDAEEVAGAILAVLRHLEVPSATFAGFGPGAEVAASLARDHPDRTDALVVIGGEDARLAAAASETTRPTLLLEYSEQDVAPSDVADDIAQFARHLPAEQSVEV